MLTATRLRSPIILWFYVRYCVSQRQRDLFISHANLDRSVYTRKFDSASHFGSTSGTDSACMLYNLILKRHPSHLLSSVSPGDFLQISNALNPLSWSLSVCALFVDAFVALTHQSKRVSVVAASSHITIFILHSYLHAKMMNTDKIDRQLGLAVLQPDWRARPFAVYPHRVYRMFDVYPSIFTALFDGGGFPAVERQCTSDGAAPLLCINICITTETNQS